MRIFKIFIYFVSLLPAICFSQVNVTVKVSNKTTGTPVHIPNNITAGIVSAKLDTFLAHHVTEKAYLHFDKPYYAAGDTIYFKAYLTLGEKHEPSGLSGVLHVDLINTNNHIDQSIKLQIADGVAWGDLTLPDSLPGGNYRIRAYTNWMRNEGDDAFFVQTIPVGSTLAIKIPESGLPGLKALNNKLDLRFFPEAGSLITGIPSKVAFKAIGPNGLGINIKGQLLDNADKVVTTFTSTHLGMGYFYINPEDGKTYKAKITYADGAQDVIVLPKAEEKGIVLSINNDSIPKASVRIAASKTYFNENKNKVYSLVIWSGGVVTTVPCTLDSSVISLDILKRRLHTGIATATLFSPFGEPLCERLFFVQNYDQLNLNLTTDRTVYAKREKVTINLKALNRADSAAIGHFSVSVTDESKVPFDENNENTIMTSFLLTSDLKGYVEQPNYYLNHITEKTNSDLDLVMLTHGYRRFEWKRLLENGYPPVTYQPERGLEIAGKVTSLTGKPLKNATVSLIPITKGDIITALTDNNGNFIFKGLTFSDTTRFELSAVNANGKNATQIIWFKNAIDFVILNNSIETVPKAGSDVSLAYMINIEKQQEQLNKMGMGKGKMLKEVKITSSKIAALKIYPRYGVPDQTIRGDQIAYGGTFAVRLMGLIHGVHFVNMGGNAWRPVLNRPSKKPMLIVLNGEEMPRGFDFSTITGTVESVEVITNSSAETPIFDGTIIINTVYGLQAKDISSTGVLSINASGFYKAKEFYSPKYEHKPDSLARPDLRSTIYWNPELRTDRNGDAVFNYYNSDGAGTYKIVIEGIDENGYIGRQVYRYQKN
ncbi:MAG: hypothetical protein JWP45_1739 [Mucilaginibacter sp.]|nr:hypothetical protein [Mucilaginibacter sp.]